MQENSTDSNYQQSSGAEGRGRVNVPREIYLLIDHLYKIGLKTPQLFTVDRKYITNPNINDIRDWLNMWITTDFRECALVSYDFRSINQNLLISTIYDFVFSWNGTYVR